MPNITIAEIPSITSVNSGEDIITIPGLAIIAGTCSSGKSHLIEFIAKSMFLNKKIDYIIVITMTPNDYEWLDERFVHKQYSNDLLARILKKQRETDYKLLLIFDDMIGALDFNSKLITILTTEYRHFGGGISIIFATQYIYKIPPTIRETANRCILFAQNTKKALQATFDTYGQLNYNSLHEWTHFMQQVLTGYNFLLINTRAASSNSKIVVKCAPTKIKNIKIYFA